MVLKLGYEIPLLVLFIALLETLVSFFSYKIFPHFLIYYNILDISYIFINSMVILDLFQFCYF